MTTYLRINEDLSDHEWAWTHSVYIIAMFYNFLVAKVWKLRIQKNEKMNQIEVCVYIATPCQYYNLYLFYTLSTSYYYSNHFINLDIIAN